MKTHFCPKAKPSVIGTAKPEGEAGALRHFHFGAISWHLKG